MNALNLIWLISLVFCQLPSLNIVIHAGLGSYSHIRGLLDIGTNLKLRGHQIHLVATDDTLDKTTEFNFTTHSLGSSLMKSDALVKKIRASLTPKRREDTTKTILRNSPSIYSIAYSILYPPFHHYLTNNKPNLIICDSISQPCTDLAMLHRIPLIVSHQARDGFGFSSEPLVTKSMEYGTLTMEKMSFFSRVYESVVKAPLAYRAMLPTITAINNVRSQFGVPPQYNFVGGESYGLNIATTFSGFEVPTHDNPSMVMVGPIPVQRRSPLPEEFQSFLDSHPRTLYIALGSLMILDKKDTLLILTSAVRAWRSGSIDGVIWGMGRTPSENFPESIEIDNELIPSQIFTNHPDFKIVNWAPQPAILNHPSTQLFITHGGMESTMEAIERGIPMLTMPFFGDQFRNAAKVERAGIGHHINRFTTTPTEIVEMIQTLITDPEVKAQGARMKMISHFEGRKLQLAIDTIESHAYVAQTCRPYQPHLTNGIPCEMTHRIPPRLPYFQSQLFDVYLFLLTLSSLLVVTLIWGLTRVARYLIRKTRVTRKLKSC